MTLQSVLAPYPALIPNSLWGSDRGFRISLRLYLMIEAEQAAIGTSDLSGDIVAPRGCMTMTCLRPHAESLRVKGRVRLGGTGKFR